MSSLGGKCDQYSDLETGPKHLIAGVKIKHNKYNHKLRYIETVKQKVTVL